MAGQKKQQQRRKTLKQGWWKHETDMLKIEAMQRDVRKRMWGTYAWMATEARPHLYNNAYKVSGTAMHLLNNEKLTTIAESRKIDRQFAVKEDEWPVQVDYVYSSGYVNNIKDDKGVFHADVDSEHATTEFTNLGVSNRPVTISEVDLKTTEDIWDPRYISAIRVLFNDKNAIQRVLTEFAKKDNASHLAITPVDARAAELLWKFSNTDSKFKYHKPVVIRTFTTDYTLYTISLVAENDDLDSHFVKVHKRMVLVESNIGQAFKLPLTEELFVEFYKKPQSGSVGNLLLEARSVVFTAAATKVSNATGLGTLPEPLQVQNTCSHLHFFGNNAFSVKIPKHSPVKRGGFKSVHNAAAFMAGWTIRELISATSEFGIVHTEPDETFHSHLLRKDGNLYKDVLERHSKTVLAADIKDSSRDVVRNSFIGRQDAKTLLSGKDGKMFYVKVWMATPTMAVICLSPQEDGSKNNVFVWALGSKFDRSEAFVPAQVDIGVPGANEAASSSGMRAAYEPPTDRRGPFSRRLFESARHRSTLPPELELELQSL